MHHGCDIGRLGFLAFAACLSGCGAGTSTASLGLPAAPTLVSLEQVAQAVKPGPVASATGYVPSPSTETYALVARGVTSCWFGAGGALKASHIFYADAEPPSSGGKAEIALLERDPSAPSMRGSKTYRISLVPDGTGTKLELINHKLPESTTTALALDVHRFAAGDLSCAATGPLVPVVFVPPPPADSKASKASRKQTARAG